MWYNKKDMSQPIKIISAAGVSWRAGFRGEEEAAQAVAVKPPVWRPEWNAGLRVDGGASLPPYVGPTVRNIYAH